MICPTQEKKGAEILMDYCARTLDPVRTAEFEKHLEICGDCRHLVEVQSNVWKSLDQWAAEPVSPDFDARLYARVAREQAAPGWRQWWWRVSSPLLTPLAIWKPAVSLAVAGAVLAAVFVVHVPGVGDTASPRVSGEVRQEKVDIEQVEKTLDDLDILTPVHGPAS